MLYKPGKPRDEPRSYRPISLLPVMGKVLDSLLADRVYFHLRRQGRLHPLQFGFRPDTSTCHALHRLVSLIRENRRQGLHTSLVSMDVMGAFDYVWWPSVLDELRKAELPSSLFELVRSFLHRRSVELVTPGTRYVRNLQRGCPQGSCIGPLLWNVVADSALNLVMPDGVQLQAYADDMMLVVSGPSRKPMERAGNEAIVRLVCW